MNRLKHNWKWKLASLVIGFFLWSYITAGVNPTQTVTLRDVPIQIRNAETLDNRRLVITQTQPQTMTVVVTGKRNVLGSMRNRDVQAVIDVEGLGEGTHDVTAKFDKPTEVVITNNESTSVSVTIEQVVTKHVKVTVEQLGQLEPQYIMESIVSTPDTVEISGARSRVDQVDHLRAEVDVANLTKDSSSNVRIVAVNAENEPVEGIELGLSNVNVAIAILKQKEVPIDIAKTGVAQDGYSISDLALVPNKILVKGKTDAIDRLNHVFTRTIDLSTLIKDETRRIDIAFPAGIAPVNADQTVMLTAKVAKKQDAVVELPMSKIVITGLPDTLKAVPVDPNGKVSVEVHGLPDEIKALTPDTLRLTADFTGLTAGVHSVRLNAEAQVKALVKSVSPESVNFTVLTK